MKRSIDGFRQEAAAQGIDLEQLKQADLGLANHIWRLAQWQLAHGLISRETCASALEAASEHHLAHIADNPEVYRAARTTGYFDSLRHRAGGWDRPNESAEAGERRRAKALQEVAALAADIEFRQRHAAVQNNPEAQRQLNKQYYEFMDYIASPGEFEELRRRFNVADVVDGDLEGNLAIVTRNSSP